MAFESKNMNYIYNVSYFEGLKWDGSDENLLKRHNCDIENFRFKSSSPSENWKSIKGYRSFCLYTMYPGLLIGTGNEHSLKMDGALKCGFSFDYTTGLPYIPGSSLKGAMRACFPGDGKSVEMSEEYTEYIKGVLSREDVDIDQLKVQIFDNSDMFLGAFPVVGTNGSQLMQMEFITPHTAGKFKNPNPISQIKVRPNVKFEFCFALTDYMPEDDSRPVTADEKLELFKMLILDMGIGAKTHVGFGRFSEKKTPLAEGQNGSVSADHGSYAGSHDGQKGSSAYGSRGGSYGAGQNDGAPMCRTPGCPNHVKKNMNTGRWFPYCQECSRKWRQSH